MVSVAGHRKGEEIGLAIDGMRIDFSGVPREAQTFIARHTSIFKEMVSRTGARNVIAEASAKRVAAVRFTDIFNAMLKRDDMTELSDHFNQALNLGADRSIDRGQLFVKTIEEIAKKVGLWGALSQRLIHETPPDVAYTTLTPEVFALVTHYSQNDLEDKDEQNLFKWIAASQETAEETLAQKTGLLVRSFNTDLRAALVQGVTLEKINPIWLDRLKGGFHNHCFSLNLSGIAITADQLKAVLQTLPNLTELNLSDSNMSDSNITDTHLQVIAEHAKKLKRLELVHCSNLTVVGLQYLRALRQLQILSFYGCMNLTGIGLQHLAGLEQLQTLNLGFCVNLTDDGLRYLAACCGQLQTLNLNGCGKLTDAGLKYLKVLSQLRTLHLNRCSKLTDDGLQHLTALSKLQMIELAYCENLTDAGLKHLAAFKELEILTIYGCEKLTDAGLQHLAGVKHVRRNDSTK